MAATIRILAYTQDAKVNQQTYVEQCVKQATVNTGTVTTGQLGTAFNALVNAMVTAKLMRAS